MMQLDAEDVGPSLRYARAKVAKLTRATPTPPSNSAGSVSNGAGADPWSTPDGTGPADDDVSFCATCRCGCMA